MVILYFGGKENKMQVSPNDIPFLIASDGPLSGQNWMLDSDRLIGRDAECHIVINDRQVSRKHAKLLIRDDCKFFIEDTGSKNGTFVNGDRISGPIILNEGDEIKIAAVQTFYYISSDATIPLQDQLLSAKRKVKSRPIFLDVKSRRVFVKGDEMTPPLSDAQYRLLETLFKKEGYVVNRDEIVNSVWGESEAAGVTEQAIDALVRRLRNRIQKEDPALDLIKTIRGVGFIFENLE